MMRSLLHTSVFIFIFLVDSTSHAAVDNVKQDFQTGAWIFTVNNPQTNQQKTWQYMPRNLIKPIVRDGFKWSSKNQFLYSYDLRNDSKSKQAISYMWATHAKMDVNGLPIKPELYRGEEINAFTTWRNALNIYLDKSHALSQSFILKPPNWIGRVTIDEAFVDKTTGTARSFGWFSGFDLGSTDVTNFYLLPGQSLRGAGLVRPELPGVGVMEFQGATTERGRPADFPDEGPLAEKMDELEENDSIFIPVIVPAVSIPVPYSGAKLAMNLQRELGYWVELGVAKQEVIDRLKRQFDVFIPALQINNKDIARAAAYEIYKELFTHHHGLTHRHFDEDRHDHESKPMPQKQKVKKHSLTHEDTALNRVAARALGINMMYLMTRLELDR